MAKGSLPPCLFHYHNGFDKNGCKKLSNNSSQPVMKFFILINYVYFGCLAALFLYDVLFYKIFSFGRFVFTNCFKKCPACDDLKNVKKEKRRISFSLPAPEEHPSQLRLSALDHTILSRVNKEIDPSENPSSEIPRPRLDPIPQYRTTEPTIGIESSGKRRAEYTNGQQSLTKPEFVRTPLTRQLNCLEACRSDHGFTRPNPQQIFDNGYKEPLSQSRQQRTDNLLAENPRNNHEYAEVKNIECRNFRQAAATGYVGSPGYGNNREASRGDSPETEDPRVYYRNIPENRGPGTPCVRSREDPQNSDAHMCTSRSECAETGSIDDDGSLTPGSGASGVPGSGKFGSGGAPRSGSECQRWSGMLLSSEAVRLRHDERSRESPIRPVNRDINLELLPSLVRNILRKGAGGSDGMAPAERATSLETDVVDVVGPEQDGRSFRSPTQLDSECPSTPQEPTRRSLS